MLALRRFVLACLPALLLVGAACGGDDDDDSDASTPPGATESSSEETGTAPAANGGGDPTASSTQPSGGGEEDAVDVCALLSQEEVEDFIGVPPDEPVADEAFPPFYGCVWESELPNLRVDVVAWSNEDDAKSSMAFLGGDEYPEIDGIGDEAYDTRPFDDVSFRTGRYEVSVGIVFSDDDDADFAASIEIARLVEARLP